MDVLKEQHHNNLHKDPDLQDRMHLLRGTECHRDHQVDQDQVDLHHQDVECHQVALREDLVLQALADLLHLREDLDSLAEYLHPQDLVHQAEAYHLDVLNPKWECNDLDHNKHQWGLEEPEAKESLRA